MAEITLKLTGLQRFNLHGVVANKRYETDEDAEMFYEFGELIKLSEEAVGVFLAPPDRAGKRALDEVAFERFSKAADHTKEFQASKDTARRILTRLREWRKDSNLAPVDTIWYMPLKRQLEAATGE